MVTRFCAACKLLGGHLEPELDLTVHGKFELPGWVFAVGRVVHAPSSIGWLPGSRDCIENHALAFVGDRANRERKRALK